MADMELMRIWQEMEGIQDEYNEAEDDVDDDDYRKIEPVTVSYTSYNELMALLKAKGVDPVGFEADNVKKLQEIYNRESQEQDEKARKERKENRRKAAQQAGLQKKRMEMETKVQEEIDELESNFQVNAKINSIKQNEGITTVKLNINSIIARALAKALCLNHTVICLDLSSNQLNDNAGSYLARVLKKNNTLQKMELDNNCFGPQALKAFAESLHINTSLVHLSLDSNSLVGPVEETPDYSGVLEFAAMFKVNGTLKFLNLWRTNLGERGGRAIAQGLEDNHSLLFCDVSHNSIHVADAMSIARKLDQNLAAYESRERQRRLDVLSDEEKQRLVQAADEAERKEQELKVWLNDRREKRSIAKTKIEEAQKRSEHEEAERLRKKYEKEREEKQKAEAGKEDGKKDAKKKDAKKK